MREQHNIAHFEQFFRNIWLIFKNVKPRPAQSAVAQCMHQCRFVYCGSSSDVDQCTLRTKRLDHILIDKMSCPRPTRSNTDQHITVLRHFDQAGIISKSHLLPSASVVANLGPKYSQFSGERFADPPKTQDANFLSVSSAGQRRGAIFRPCTGTDIMIIHQNVSIT